jgi:hypothetical protein
MNAECGMRNAECGMRNAECGVRSAECGVRNMHIYLGYAWHSTPAPLVKSHCLNVPEMDNNSNY